MLHKDEKSSLEYKKIKLEGIKKPMR